MSLQSEFAGIAAADGRAALVTVIAGTGIGSKLLVRADGSTDGGLGSAELDASAWRRPRIFCGPSARRRARPATPRCSSTSSRPRRGW